MADQIKGIKLPANLFRKGLKQHTLLLKLLHQCHLLLCRSPVLQKCVKTLILAAHGLFRIILQGFRNQATVCPVILHPFSDNRDLHVLHDIFQYPTTSRAGLNRRFPAAFRIEIIVLQRWTVPVRVGEVLCRLPEVHNRKILFAKVLFDSGTPPDNLLKLRHGPDTPVNNNQFHRLGINTR